MSARSAKMKDTKSKIKQKANTDDENFFTDVLEATEEHYPDFTKSINIALIGKVSSGKSSLLNALLRRTRENPAVTVGSISGVTTKVQAFRLHEQFLVVDSPGLDDVVTENSEETRKFLKHIDLAILIVSGSADASQKKHYDDARHYAKRVVVVLNKIDEWDDLDESGLQSVVVQWKEILGTDVIYPVCAKGFDPKTKIGTDMDLRGVDEVRNEIESFFEEEGKDLLLAHVMGDKKPAAIKIISTSLVLVAAASFVPGSAVYITAIQSTAIIKLYYIYCGKKLEAKSAITVLTTLVAKSLGQTIFLWAKTIVEAATIVSGPLVEIVIGAAGAAVAVSLTLAALGAVNFMLQHEYELNEKDLLRDQFVKLKGPANLIVSSTDLSKIKTPNFWLKILGDFLP